MTSERGAPSSRVLGCEETNGASKQNRKPINKKESADARQELLSPIRDVMDQRE